MSRDSRGTEVWTAGQQVALLILHLGHDSYKKSHHPRLSPALYSPSVKSWPQTPFIMFCRITVNSLFTSMDSIDNKTTLSDYQPILLLLYFTYTGHNINCVQQQNVICLRLHNFILNTQRFTSNQLQIAMVLWVIVLFQTFHTSSRKF